MMKVDASTAADFSERRFLNLDTHYTVASIMARVDAFDVMSNPDDNEVSASVVIGDCRRTVTLEFNINSPIDMDNAVHKLDTMTEVIEQFKSHLIAEGIRCLASKGQIWVPTK